MLNLIFLHQDHKRKEKDRELTEALDSKSNIMTNSFCFVKQSWGGSLHWTFSAGGPAAKYSKKDRTEARQARFHG